MFIDNVGNITRIEDAVHTSALSADRPSAGQAGSDGDTQDFRNSAGIPILKKVLIGRKIMS